MRRALLLVLVVLSLAAATSEAQTSRPAPPPPAAPSEPAIHAYGDRDKTCVAWTDGCRSCVRGASDAVTCSNIGIACQPAAIICSARQAK